MLRLPFVRCLEKGIQKATTNFWSSPLYLFAHIHWDPPVECRGFSRRNSREPLSPISAEASTFFAPEMEWGEGVTPGNPFLVPIPLFLED